jgi:hypothetical protein
MKPKFRVLKEYLKLDTSGSPRDRREALRWSIAKWKFIMEHKEIKFCGGTNTCGCCIKSGEQEGLYFCAGCLIAKYGRNDCQSTPYRHWMRRPNGAKKMYEYLKKVYKHYYGDK